MSEFIFIQLFLVPVCQWIHSSMEDNFDHCVSWPIQDLHRMALYPTQQRRCTVKSHYSLCISIRESCDSLSWSWKRNDWKTGFCVTGTKGQSFVYKRHLAYYSHYMPCFPFILLLGSRVNYAKNNNVKLERFLTNKCS